MIESYKELALPSAHGPSTTGSRRWLGNSPKDSSGCILFGMGIDLLNASITDSRKVTIPSKVPPLEQKGHFAAESPVYL